MGRERTGREKRETREKRRDRDTETESRKTGKWREMRGERDRERQREREREGQSQIDGGCSQFKGAEVGSASSVHPGTNKVAVLDMTFVLNREKLSLRDRLTSGASQITH